MQCSICHRTSNFRLPFDCTTCARNALYGPRIQHAQVLLEAETLAHEVENKVTLSRSGQSHNDTSATPRDVHLTFAAERLAAEQAIVEERTGAILAQADSLRQQTKEMKDYISREKANLSERRSTLDAANKRLSERRNNDLEPLEKGIKRTEYHWDALHSKTAEARSFLCTEAAQLYGLQQRKRKKGIPGRDLYLIGGTIICDLRELNSGSWKILEGTSLISADASPSQISTSTTSLAHLTHLISHYLGLRLPAEITLSHRDYPLPTIFSPGSSYSLREARFPGLTPSHSSNNSPSASRTADQGPSPRPRPLHLNKKLPALAKDDPLAYAAFVEGVTLLAWDIAWMCKTQGLDISNSTWEYVCAMGKNLWQLLLGPPPTLRRQPSARDLPVVAAARLKALAPTTSQPSLGHFSHVTGHSFLSASEGVDYMSGWRLQSHIKVIDKVKAMLLSERDGAEWQILEENEWEEGNTAMQPSRGDGVIMKTGEETVLIDGEAEAPLQVAPGNQPGIESAPKSEDDPERMKGTSGWTKLKSRGTS